MSTVDLNLETDEDINIAHGRVRSTVSITAEISDVLAHFDVSDIVGYFDADELLDAIGVEAAKDHFNLIEEA